MQAVWRVPASGKRECQGVCVRLLLAIQPPVDRSGRFQFPSGNPEWGGAWKGFSGGHELGNAGEVDAATRMLNPAGWLDTASVEVEKVRK